MNRYRCDIFLRLLWSCFETQWERILQNLIMIVFELSARLHPNGYPCYSNGTDLVPNRTELLKSLYSHQSSLPAWFNTSDWHFQELKFKKDSLNFSSKKFASIAFNEQQLNLIAPSQDIPKTSKPHCNAPEVMFCTNSNCIPSFPAQSLLAAASLTEAATRSDNVHSYCNICAHVSRVCTSGLVLAAL